MTRFLLRLTSMVTFCFMGVVLLALAVGYILILPNNELVLTGDLRLRRNLIFRMDIAHQLIHEIKTDTLYNIDPMWSPDGQHIAFISLLGQPLPTTYLMDEQGGKLHRFQVVPQGSNSLTWSPDGQYIAFVGYHERWPDLMLSDIHSGLTRRLTNNSDSERDPTWSLDSQHLTFISNGRTKTVSTLDIQTGDSTVLITGANDYYYPVWSPDGRYLSLTANGRLHGFYLWDSIQKQVILLYSNPSAPTNPPDWSSDGRFIIYTAVTPISSSGIFQMDVNECLRQPNTCTPQLLTPGHVYFYHPRWRPQTP